MFGWLKKTKADDPSRQARGSGEPVIAAVLLERGAFPGAFPFDDFQKQLEKLRIGKQTATNFALDDSVAGFSAGDESFGIALMPAPYPWTDLKGPCATAWMWPKETPATSVQRHRTHLLVTMMGGHSDPVTRRLMLTAVTALAAKQPGVMGVYWPEGTLVHYPKVFIEMAQKITSAEAPPLYLWVDYRLFRNPEGTFGLFTTGLRPLGHMEIEIPTIDMRPGELREWAINISYYLLENGPILQDGNTIGVDADHQVSIRHTKSLYGKKETVMRFAGA